MRHAETLLALEAEREKVQMAVTEVNVLRKQLEREKATFEKAYVAMCTTRYSVLLILLYILKHSFSRADLVWQSLKLYQIAQKLNKY